MILIGASFSTAFLLEPNCLRLRPPRSSCSNIFGVDQVIDREIGAALIILIAPSRSWVGIPILAMAFLIPLLSDR